MQAKRNSSHFGQRHDFYLFTHKKRLDRQIPEEANIKYLDYYFLSKWMKVEEKEALFAGPE